MSARLYIWVDTTSRDQAGNVYGISHEYRTKSLEVVVRQRPGSQGSWVLSCVELGIGARDLRSTLLDEVKREAITYLREHVLKLHAELTRPANDGS